MARPGRSPRSVKSYQDRGTSPVGRMVQTRGHSPVPPRRTLRSRSKPEQIAPGQAAPCKHLDFPTLPPVKSMGFIRPFGSLLITMLEGSCPLQWTVHVWACFGIRHTRCDPIDIDQSILPTRSALRHYWMACMSPAGPLVGVVGSDDVPVRLTTSTRRFSAPFGLAGFLSFSSP